MSEPSEALPTHLESPPAAATSSGIFDAVRESLRGGRRDFTEGSLGRAIVVLAIPMVLETFMESVFAICDVFFVSRLGADAIATVGLTESLITTIYAVAIGLAIGARATVARRLGEHDAEGAADAAVQAIALGGLFAIGLGILGVIFGPRLLAAMGATPDILATGSTFSRVMLGGSGTVLLLFLVNAIFRGAGDPTLAMRSLWLANAINIALGPCLIFGFGPFPKMGVVGAATATTIGRGVGVIYALSRLFSPKGARHVQVRWRHLRIHAPVLRAMLRLSSSGALQAFIATASWMGLVRILSAFGADALAGYTIAMRVVQFALLPAFGMSNAAATLVGQSLGARKPDRAEQAVWRTARYNAWFLGVEGLLLVLTTPLVVGLFTADPAVASFATNALRIIALGFVFYAYGMTVTQSFNGAGDTRTPTLLNIFIFWAFEIPLAWTLSTHTALGARGVFIAVTLAFSALAVVSSILFRQGRWKSKRV